MTPFPVKMLPAGRTVRNARGNRRRRGGLMCREGAYAGETAEGPPEDRQGGGETMNRRGVRLGRILGVEIFLRPSWCRRGGLIACVLGQGFSAGSPSFSGAGAVVLGLMGAVLFFASLLAHELAHSVVAERKGIPVHRITLFLLGGAAQITREPSTAGDEAKIALAGPALSVVLGVLLLGLGLVADQVGALAGAALFGTLGAINLLLAAFNMLPGFPMDGGRAVRARPFPVVGPSGRIEGGLPLAGLAAIPRERWATLTAGDAMVPMALEMVASAAEPYEWVVARVAANPAGRFVVLDGGRLVGVLSCR